MDTGGQILSFLFLSDLMRININIYLTRSRSSKFEINHPHNNRDINIFRRNWRHYEGIQMHENEQLFELPVQNEAADIDFIPS